MAETGETASRLEISGSIAQVNDYFYRQGWTDGLPIIPPTEDLVLEMLEASPLPAKEVLGVLPPLNGAVTVEKVAETLGIHGGTAVFGSGHRANATIGRALRLTMRNLGGATAETMEKSTQGWPGKYTMCFAENREANPWEPLHVEPGFPPSASTVTVVASRGIHSMVEATQETGLGVLETLVSSMKAGGISGYSYQGRGASPVIVLGPEHAQEIAAAGFSRRDVREYIFQNARLPLGELKDRGHYGSRSWPTEFEGQNDDFMVPLVTDPDRLVLVVAGGDGRHSSWFPAWSATQRATEVIG